MSRIKAWLEKNNPGRVDQFMKDAPAAVKSIVSKIDDLRVTIPSLVLKNTELLSASTHILQRQLWRLVVRKVCKPLTLFPVGLRGCARTWSNPAAEPGSVAH